MKVLLLVPITKWILACLLLSSVAAVTWHLLSQRLLRQKYQKMRKPQERQKKPVYVRRTDLMKLTPSQEKERRRAHILLERGQILDAARILESINLQREAVTALEESGHIDEACAVLLRLNRPNRAAAVYARHGLHAKAAEYYLAAKSPEEAAHQYLEAAKADPSCFEKAGHAFEAIPRHDLALQAYMSGKTSERVVALAFQLEAWDTLAAFMSERGNAKSALACMDTVKIKAFIEKITIDEKTLPWLAMWSDTYRKTDFLAAVLKRLGKHLDALTAYWQLLPRELAAQLCAALSKSVNPSTREGLSFLTCNGHALYNAKLYNLAASIYTVAERHAMAGKCHALAAQLDQCLSSLQLANDELLVRRFQDAIEATADTQAASDLPEGRWHPETVSAVRKALENIDPDSDDVATRSPFSIVA